VHGKHAIDQALAHELSAAGRSARAVHGQERVQLPENPFIAGRGSATIAPSAARSSWYNKAQSPCVEVAPMAARRQRSATWRRTIISNRSVAVRLKFPSASHDKFHV
jgi:hypothetical protein